MVGKQKLRKTEHDGAEISTGSEDGTPESWTQTTPQLLCDLTQISLPLWAQGLLHLQNGMMIS